MAGKNVHQVKHGSGWVNRKEGTNQVSSTHRTQQAAIDRGRQMAKQEKSEHLIHGRNGQIRERNTYTGEDPFPPRG